MNRAKNVFKDGVFNADSAQPGSASHAPSQSPHSFGRASPTQRERLATTPRYRPGTRRPAAVIDGTINHTESDARPGPAQQYDRSADNSRQARRWPAIRWSLAGFAIGIVFWHFVGFWDFLRQVILDPNQHAAAVSRPISKPAQIEHEAETVSSTRTGAHQLTLSDTPATSVQPAPSIPIVTGSLQAATPGAIEPDCVALVRHPNGEIVPGACQGHTPGMNQSAGIVKGDLTINKSATAKGHGAAKGHDTVKDHGKASPWSTSFVKPAERLAVQIR